MIILKARIDACVAAGISRANIAIDPGIGFGKTFRHNLDLLNQMTLFHGLGVVVAAWPFPQGFYWRADRRESCGEPG